MARFENRNRVSTPASLKNVPHGQGCGNSVQAAIPVAWTFMSEILTRQGRIIERLSGSNNHRFDRVLWPCDGQECPSYIRWPAVGEPGRIRFDSVISVIL